MRNCTRILVEQLEELFDFQSQWLNALPRLLSAASSPHLRRRLQRLQRESERELSNLRAAFRLLSLEVPAGGRGPQPLLADALKVSLPTADAGSIAGVAALLGESDAVGVDLDISLAAQEIRHRELSLRAWVHALAAQLEEADLARLLGPPPLDADQTRWLAATASRWLFESAA